MLGFGHIAFGVPVRGSLPAVFAVGALGALCFGGLGLLVGSRARRIETVTGLMNVVMMPMFVLSGIFFSADRFPQVLQPLIRILPLTALNDALRAVVLEGLHLSALSAPLAVLTAWTRGQLRGRPEALPLGLGKAARRARRRRVAAATREGGFRGGRSQPACWWPQCEHPPRWCVSAPPDLIL